MWLKHNVDPQVEIVRQVIIHVIQIIFMVKRLIKISFGRINSINAAILIFSKKI